jgi:THO complex subunit 1
LLNYWKKHFSKVSLVILRACNELLRRLSRAEDAVFCGRVFIYVFQSFPLHDRSSVNRQGDYNSENVTTFDDLPERLAKDEDHDVSMTDASNEVSAATGASKTAEYGQKPSSPITVDELYPVFWGLQKSFAYPPRVFDSDTLDKFKKEFEATLTKFKDMPKVMAESIVERRRDSKKKMDYTDQEDFANSFNPKYLTSRELFELEVSSNRLCKT